MSFVCTCVVKSPQTALNFSPYSMPGTHGVSPWKASHSEKQIVKPQEGRCKAAGRRWWSFVGHQSQSCEWMRPHVVYKAWEAWGCQHCKDATSFLVPRCKRDGKDGLRSETSGVSGSEHRSPRCQVPKLQQWHQFWSDIWSGACYQNGNLETHKT